MPERARCSTLALKIICCFSRRYFFVATLPPPLTTATSVACAAELARRSSPGAKPARLAELALFFEAEKVDAEQRTTGMSSRSDVTTCTNFDHGRLLLLLLPLIAFGQADHFRFRRLAPRFVGTLVAVLLTGIFSTQAWSYFVGLKKRQSESKWLQAFVSALVNLISAQVTTSAVLSYYSVRCSLLASAT